MKIIISESQHHLLSESDSFELFMRRNYSELKEDLIEQLRTNNYVCDMRLNMYSNYVRGVVADIYLDRQSRDWFDLYDFLRKVFNDLIVEDYTQKSKNCN